MAVYATQLLSGARKAGHLRNSDLRAAAYRCYNISELNPACSPLSYPLLVPDGKMGRELGAHTAMLPYWLLWPTPSRM